MAAVYLIPSVLEEDSIETIPFYVTRAIRECSVFFTENERTTRRYFKKLWKTFLPGEDIVIDEYEWYVMGENTETVFLEKLKAGKTIGIVSEAGCPGVADPGQSLAAIAQRAGVEVKPLAGPSSILLALMASGMNGQQFRFTGYLPIDAQERVKAIRELEAESARLDCTQIFIETPYRNNQLTEALLKNCKPGTRLCIAADLTGKTEWIKTKKVADWKRELPDLHKRPVIFLLYADR